MASKNCILSYVDNGTAYSHALWVNSVEQPQILSGDSHQSKFTRMFYPKTHSPGDMTLIGNCESQEDYQQLAHFIRRHHKALLNTPANQTFTRNDVKSAGYQRLLKLSIASEGLLLRGFIKTINISKKGVFDPAPEFNLAFTPIYDNHAIDIHLSTQVQKWYSDQVSRANVYEADNSDPDNPK